MGKARVYLYNKQRIIQKVVMLDEEGNESDPLPYVINYGFLADSIIFGTDMKIAFFIHPNGIELYDCGVDKLEFINNSENIYNIRCYRQQKYLVPNRKWYCKIKR